MVNGKTALVTGSTSGIGLGIARAFAAQGANIVLNGFGDAGEIEALRSSLAKEYGVEVLYDGADLSKLGEIETMMSKALAAFGGIDILINNGGIQEQVIKDVLLAAQPTKKFAQIDEVAAFAVFLASDGAASITSAVLPIEGGWTAH